MPCCDAEVAGAAGGRQGAAVDSRRVEQLIVPGELYFGTFGSNRTRRQDGREEGRTDERTDGRADGRADGRIWFDGRRRSTGPQLAAAEC